MFKKIKLIVIAGPTAVGKTDFSIYISKYVNGEVINADSMQIYKYLDIGTSKIKPEEMKGIKHHLIDIRFPDQNYSIYDYINDAKEAIKKINYRCKTPILVGGSGLYIQSLLLNYNLVNNKIDSNILKKIKDGTLEENLYFLKKIDYSCYSDIDKKNKRRVERAIYNRLSCNKTYNDRIVSQKVEYDIFPICLQEDRNILYENINNRSINFIKKGFIEEVYIINQKYKLNENIRNAVGYKQVLQYLNGIYNKEILLTKIQQSTRNLAKKQITWFKNQKIKYFFYKKEEKKIVLDEIKKFLME